ncbi:putative RNA-directed DNA polymerase [Tanacetum coccineum]
MVLNSPCFTVKSWLVQDQTVPVQKQTAFGKDKSNPLIVDSLLKTIRLSIHLVVYNEELAIPEQTATGKGISNPLMAGSLPKTTKPTNNTYVLVDLPPGRKSIGCKWIWKIKYKSSGEVDRYKARLVAKGYSQREAYDYEETFSPIVKMVTIKCLIALSV